MLLTIFGFVADNMYVRAIVMSSLNYQLFFSQQTQTLFVAVVSLCHSFIVINFIAF